MFTISEYLASQILAIYSIDKHQAIQTTFLCHTWYKIEIVWRVRMVRLVHTELITILDLVVVLGTFFSVIHLTKEDMIEFGLVAPRIHISFQLIVCMIISEFGDISDSLMCRLSAKRRHKIKTEFCHVSYRVSILNEKESGLYLWNIRVQSTEYNRFFLE